MITEAIISVFSVLFSPFIEMLPDINLSVALNSRVANTFMDWVRLAGYMLPLNTFSQIFVIIFSLNAVRVGVAFMRFFRK